MSELIVLGFYNTLVAGAIGDSPAIVREGTLDFVRQNVLRHNLVVVYASIGTTIRSEPFVRSLLIETGIEEYLSGFYLGRHMKDNMYDLPAVLENYQIPMSDLILIGCDGTTRRTAKHFNTYFIPVPSITDEIDSFHPDADFANHLLLYGSMPSRFSLAGVDLNTKAKEYLLWSEKDKA